jgi:hypothetical protein
VSSFRLVLPTCTFVQIILFGPRGKIGVRPREAIQENAGYQNGR